MGHTAFIFGRIEGPYKDEDGATDNRQILSALPEDSDWPWLDGSMFSIPSQYHVGAVRSQLIHFGCCLKEDLSDEAPLWLDDWLNKFHGVLDKLTWHSAFILVERDTGQIIEVSLRKNGEEIQKSRDDKTSPKQRLKVF